MSSRRGAKPLGVADANSPNQTTMNIIDLNIGLAIPGLENSLTIEEINRELIRRGLNPFQSRIAQSETESTYVVRCSEDPGQSPLAWRVYLLAESLHQEAIAAVPHDGGGGAICVGPSAHLWGGAFLPQHWISLA